MTIDEVKEKYTDNRFFGEIFVKQVYSPTREIGKLDTV